MTRVITFLFLFILIFSPLAFGTVEAWSLAIMGISSLAALLFLAIRHLKDKNQAFFTVPGIIPMLCLLGYVLIQMTPLPPWLLRIVSPEIYALYGETIWTDQPATWASLSINRKATFMEFFRLSAYAAFYILTVQLLAKKDVLVKTVNMVVIFASFLAFFGIFQHILSNNKIYWLRPLTQGGIPFGPYVNRNHYAGLMEMLFPVVLSLFLYYKPHVSEKTLRDKIIELFNLNRTNIYLLLGFASVLVATSIFLTLSRSGIVSLCLSMILFGLIFISRGKQKRRGIIIVTICILIVLSVGWFGWSPIFERFEKIRNPQGDITELRLQIWHDSLNIIRDFPVYGTGFGSYENIYPKYRTIPGDGIADHAHNDYLELLSDGGILALVLSAWFLIAVFFRSYRTFRKRHETYSIYIFIAGITGIIAILMHSVTDFNFHIGANGLYFFFLCGLAVSAAHTRLHDGLNDTYLEKKNVPLRIFVIFSGFLLASSVVFYFGIIMGQMTFSSVSAVRLSEKKSAEELMPVRETAKMASLFDPLEPRYRYAAANAEKLLAHHEDALRYYRKALCLSPANAEYLQRYGLVLSELKEYAAAESFLRAGIKYDVSNPVRYKRYAFWLFSAGKRNDAEQAMKKAISMEPQKTRDYITFLILNGVSDQEILNALPDRVEPHLIYADFLERTGKDIMAEEAYLNALEYIRNEASVQESYFYALYRYYHKRGRYPEALAIMNRAVAFFPDNPQIRIFAGELYEKLGLVNKAREEYHNALVIHPGHQEAKRRLDTLIQSEKK